MQSLIGLFALLVFAIAAAACVTLGSPANRRKLAAWLIASARAQEQLQEARRTIRESERQHRERISNAMKVDAEAFRLLQERSGL